MGCAKRAWVILACPTGMLSAVGCTACAAGKFSKAVGATSPDACVAGSLSQAAVGSPPAMGALAAAAAAAATAAVARMDTWSW
jgi:hypothetical protein